MIVGVPKEVKVKEEKIGQADALVINITDSGTPFPIELIVSTDGELFVFGTRRAVQTALRGDGGLPADPAYREASQYLVPAPSSIAFLASAGLRPLAKVIELTGSRSDARQFGAVLDLISSASMSSAVRDNNAYVRLVWTLPE